MTSRNYYLSLTCSESQDKRQSCNESQDNISFFLTQLQDTKFSMYEKEGKDFQTHKKNKNLHIGPVV